MAFDTLCACELLATAKTRIHFPPHLRPRTATRPNLGPDVGPDLEMRGGHHDGQAGHFPAPRRVRENGVIAVRGRHPIVFINRGHDAL